jgi:cell division protein FtsQ
MSTRRRPSAQRRGPGVGQRMAAVRAALVAAVAPTATLLAVGLVLLLGWRGAQALYAQPVAHIVVSGKLENLHRDAVRQAVAGRIDRGLLALDLRDLRRELEALPWVYRAALRRRFPDTLEIRVVEQLPIARWGDGAFLNHEARVVQVADEARWSSLPDIRGPAGSEVRLVNRYQQLQELLRPLELTPVALEEDDFGQLELLLANGVEVALGDRQFAQRVEDFLLLWRRDLADRGQQVLRVDMRYADGAAVALRDEPQLAGLATPVEER